MYQGPRRSRRRTKRRDGTPGRVSSGGSIWAGQLASPSGTRRLSPNISSVGGPRGGFRGAPRVPMRWTVWVRLAGADVAHHRFDVLRNLLYVLGKSIAEGEDRFHRGGCPVPLRMTLLRPTRSSASSRRVTGVTRPCAISPVYVDLVRGSRVFGGAVIERYVVLKPLIAQPCGRPVHGRRPVRRTAHYHYDEASGASSVEGGRQRHFLRGSSIAMKLPTSCGQLLEKPTPVLGQPRHQPPSAAAAWRSSGVDRSPIRHLR
jgi:hypothetical protein